jgi:hypothetical protein
MVGKARMSSANRLRRGYSSWWSFHIKIGLKFSRRAGPCLMYTSHHRRCLQISINNCWPKLDELQSSWPIAALPAGVILHPRWNVSWLEANWTSDEQLVWLRDAKSSVRRFFEQQYAPKTRSEAARGGMGKVVGQDEPSQFDQWMQSCGRYMMEDEDELGVTKQHTLGDIRWEIRLDSIWNSSTEWM